MKLAEAKEYKKHPSHTSGNNSKSEPEKMSWCCYGGTNYPGLKGWREICSAIKQICNEGGYNEHFKQIYHPTNKCRKQVVGTEEDANNRVNKIDEKAFGNIGLIEWTKRMHQKRTRQCDKWK